MGYLFSVASVVTVQETGEKPTAVSFSQHSCNRTHEHNGRLFSSGHVSANVSFCLISWRAIFGWIVCKHWHEALLHTLTYYINNIG